MSFIKINSQKQNSKKSASILGYKPFSQARKIQVHESGSNFLKYSEKLSEVQKLTESVQSSLKSFQQQAASLSVRNKAISTENSELREKIKHIEEFKKQSKRIEIFSPSLTSLPTQETEILLSKNSDFSVSSCSSIDSIKVLKDQVDHVKEFKNVKRCQKKVNMHRKTNSIDQCEKKHQDQSRLKKKSKQQNLCTQKNTNFTHKLVHSALLCKIPVLRFN